MTALPRRSFLGAAAAGTGLATLLTPTGALAAPGLVVSGRPRLTHGVQSGDAVAGRATLWSRADRPARLVAELSRDPSFRRARQVRGPVVTPASDLTGEIDVRGLPGSSDLFYRITAVDLDDHRAVSAPVTGRFRTGPLGGHGRGARRQDLTFLWSGDIAGQGYGVNPDLGGYRIVDAMRRHDVDFFLCSGDNVYADGPLTEQVELPDGRIYRNLVTEEKSAVAQTLDQYRGQYKYNLMAENWRAFLAENAIVAQWDDHEVTNNWYPGEVLEDERYQEKRVDVLVGRAKQAFHEYLPVSDVSPDRAGRVYRKLSYGPLMDLFVLDMRTHKDANSAGLEPNADGGVLGAEQTRWLLRELAASRATWKVIAADLPIGLVVPDGETAQEGISNGDPGAPLGRELDIAEVLRGLQRLGIRNHVWLTADVHYTAAHHYSPERAAFTEFDPFWEFVSGPLNAGAFGPGELDDTFGARADFYAAPPRQNTSPLEGYQFYGEVHIDADTEQFTVTLRDIDGAAIYTRTLDPERR